MTYNVLSGMISLYTSTTTIPFPLASDLVISSLSRDEQKE